MSRYTNDTDTLRQMISQSLPQLFSSIVSLVAVFCSMLYLSAGLTFIVVVYVFILMKVVRTIAGRSGTFFMKCRRNRSRQNNHNQPDQPFLRYCRRQNPVRRH